MRKPHCGGKDLSGETKVAEFDPVIVCYEEVVQLYVTVNDAISVKEIQHLNDLVNVGFEHFR